ncbi:MAG: methionine biosynthesis protein MetW [PVC group bacterium]
MKSNGDRIDHRVIAELIAPRSSVLDLGCGDGELLRLLIKEKNVRAQGIEIDEGAIYKCVAKGLNVFHGDIDSGLAEYQDKSFDYVILNQSLQQVRRVETVLEDALRVGRKVIVGFPNFAHYRARWQLFFLGRAPVTGALPYQWHETPNLHFLSISDFRSYCRLKDIVIERAEYFSVGKRVVFSPNLSAQVGIFLISNRFSRRIVPGSNPGVLSARP